MDAEETTGAVPEDRRQEASPSPAGEPGPFGCVLANRARKMALGRRDDPLGMIGLVIFGQPAEQLGVVVGMLGLGAHRGVELLGVLAESACHATERYNRRPTAQAGGFRRQRLWLRRKALQAFTARSAESRQSSW